MLQLHETRMNVLIEMAHGDHFLMRRKILPVRLYGDLNQAPRLRLDIDGTRHGFQSLFHRTEYVCEIQPQGMQQNVFFILEIAVNDSRGNAGQLCDFDGSGFIISFFAERSQSGFYDFILFFDRIGLLRLSDFRHTITPFIFTV